jgi:hypothetical protein|tara:strand:+ start:1893 stop:3653 length:1761 start_codon:yes stop_codon:yes gene_type:complete
MTERKAKNIRTNLTSLLADNNQGNISAADVRDNLLDMVDSIIPIMGSGGSQTPFFNGPSGIHFRDNSVGTNDTTFNYIYGNWNRNKTSAIGFATGSDTTNKDDGSLCFYTAASGVSSSTGGHGLTKRLQIQANGEVDVYASGIGNVGLHVQSITPKRDVKKDPLLLLLQSSNNSIGAVSGEKINIGQWDTVNKTLYPTITVHESGQVVVSREGKGVGMNPVPAVSGIHYGWAELQLVNTHHMNQPNNHNHSIGSRILFKGHKDQWNQSNHPSGQAQNLFALGTDVHASSYNAEDKNNFFIQDVYTSGNPVRLFVNQWGNVGIDTVKPSGKMHVHARGHSLSTVGELNPASGIAMTLSSESTNSLFDFKIKSGVLEFATREPTKNKVMGISTDGHVGVGTLTPIDMLNVSHGSTAPSGLTISNIHGRSYKLFSGHNDITATSGQMVIQDFYGKDTPTRFAIGPSGNIGIGTNVMPVAGTSTKALVFGDNSRHAKAFDGSAGNNTAGIYAKDTGGTVKLYAFDEGNNQTTLSPHVFKYFESPDPMAWSFYSRNEDIGEEINVDMYGAIKAIEEITGKKFIHKRKLNGD